MRAFGCGSAYSAISQIAQNRPNFLEVAQFESDAHNRNRESFLAIRPEQNRLVVTHGSLAIAPAIHGRIASNPSLGRHWRDSIGVNLTDRAVLCGFLLRHSLDVNPGGQVLFRASTPERVRATLTALRQTPPTSDLPPLEWTQLTGSTA